MPIVRFALDTLILAGLLFIALFVYALYTEPEMLETMFCMLNTDSDLGYTTCRITNY